MFDCPSVCIRPYTNDVINMTTYLKILKDLHSQDVFIRIVALR